MYLLVSLWQMPEGPWNRLQPLIEGDIASVMGGANGVIQGYWTFDTSNGKSIGLVLLETADQAYDLRNALEQLMEDRNEEGVELEMIRVQEIVARLVNERHPDSRATHA